MKYCFNCNRVLEDNEECSCMDVKMSDNMVKVIQDNNYDLYDKDRLNDIIKTSIIEKEKELENTISILNELEELMKKLDVVKEALDKLDNLYELPDTNLEKVDAGLLSKDTVWKTKERYYEILDEIRTKIDELGKKD